MAQQATTPDAPDTTSPEAVATRIGREYVETDLFPTEDTDTTRDAYDEIAKAVNALYDRIAVDVTYTSRDPYDDYEHMRKRVFADGELKVYDEYADTHPELSIDANLKFRAVHDYWGHLYHDVDFSPAGEFLKWYKMRELFPFSDNASRALFADVVGQVGEVYYLPDSFDDERFTQRAFLAPQRWILWMTDAVLWD